MSEVNPASSPATSNPSDFDWQSAAAQALHQAEAYENQPDLQEHLAYACLKGLCSRKSLPVVTDAFQHGRQLKGAELLATGLALADWIQHNIPEKRVGIVLPPGLGTIVANLAVVLADKIPVNLNFTAGPISNQAAIRRAGLQSIITAEGVVKKLGTDFPWPANRIDIAEVLKTLGRFPIAWRLGLIYTLPAPLLASLFRIPRQGGAQEAALLFTSGSVGEPKGVVLTHRNIVGNVRQISETLPFGIRNRILGCLPTFHSFGFTVTIWWPLLGGPEVVTYLSPLETGKLCDVIEKYNIELAITTPTFLRGFLRKGKEEQLRNLKMFVTGAEKLPLDLAESFEAKFHVPVREGYGLTETSPVLSVNLVAPEGCRRGTVGRPIPGVAIRVTTSTGDTPQNPREQGMLWYRGVNIFAGYLDDTTRTQEVLQDGWFKSGDLGRIDADGFLHIEGRLSRFSKIAGEMVPHGTIETAIEEAFTTVDQRAELHFVITARPHAERGEELVLLTTQDLTREQLLPALRAKGFPNLWTPSIIQKIDAIPLLASGKLDLKRARELAQEAP